MMKKMLNKILAAGFIVSLAGGTPSLFADEQAIEVRKINFSFITEALQEAARVVAAVAPVLVASGAGPEAAVLNIIGQVVEIVTKLKKEQTTKNGNDKNEMRERQQESSLCCQCNKEETRVASIDEFGRLMSIITSAAQLPSVNEDSHLFLFKKAGVRSQQELLLRAMIADEAGRRVLVKDLFDALRQDGLKGINTLMEAEVIPDSVIEFFQSLKQIFGLTFWKESFITWFHFIVDTLQVLVNNYVDTLQEGISAYTEQYAKEKLNNPLLEAAIQQANTIIQHQFDDFQNTANSIIDEQQALVK